MKANGIHPNGGPSNSSPIQPPLSTKSVSKSAIAKAAAKRRKIEGEETAHLKESDEDRGESHTSPNMEYEEKACIKTERIKTEPRADLGMTLPCTNYSLSADLSATAFDLPPDCSLNSGNSIFDEFCIPEMFAQHTFEEPKSEKEPRYLQPSPAVMTHRNSNAGRSGNGKDGLESILITD